MGSDQKQSDGPDISITSVAKWLQVLYALSPLHHDKEPRVDYELAEALVVCFSVANTLGRIAAGYLSELALHRAVRGSHSLVAQETHVYRRAVCVALSRRTGSISNRCICMLMYC